MAEVVRRHDHTRAEALQWALNHAEAAEAADKAYRHYDPKSALGQEYLAQALKDLQREVLLASMWSGIAQAMPQ